METPNLDEFFGPKQSVDEAYRAHAEADPVERDLKAGQNEPREFYHFRNRATQALNETWSRWTGIPTESKGGKNQHRCVAKLLSETPDLEAIEAAVGSLSAAGRIYPGMDMYYMRKIVENELSKLAASKDQYRRLAQQVEDLEQEDEIPTCDKCGRSTWRPGEDCKWH